MLAVDAERWTGNGTQMLELTRIWAVPAPSRTIMVLAQTQPPADDAATSAWFDTAEDIVASLEFD